MKVFYTSTIGKREWRDGCAREQGQPLACWWPEAEAAYKAAGSPGGKIVIRHRVVADGYDAGVNDGMRSGAFSGVTMIQEVGVL